MWMSKYSCSQQKQWRGAVTLSSKASVCVDFREQSPLYAAAARRNWTFIFPSMHPVAVLNSMFPLLYPVWQERGLFWEIGSRQEQLKICLNKGAKCLPDRSQTLSKWSVPVALSFLHKHWPFSHSQSCTCQTWHSLIKLVNAPRLLRFRPPAKAITAGCTVGCWSLPLTSGHSRSSVLCFFSAIQLTSATVGIQHYHIIYEGQPSGMQLKQE